FSSSTIKMRIISVPPLCRSVGYHSCPSITNPAEKNNHPRWKTIPQNQAVFWPKSRGAPPLQDRARSSLFHGLPYPHPAYQLEQGGGHDHARGNGQRQQQSVESLGGAGGKGPLHKVPHGVVQGSAGDQWHRR